MKPFKCITQLILQYGIFVLLAFFTFVSLTACFIHEYVILENTCLGGGSENQNQTDSNKAIVSPFIKIPGGEE